MTALWITLALLAVLCAILVGAVLWMYRFAMVRTKKPETIYWNVTLGELPPPEKLRVPESLQEDLWKKRRWLLDTYKRTGQFYTISSTDGLTLAAHYIPPAKEPRGIFLMVHGYRSSGFHDFGGAVHDMTRDGFGCLVIDQRAHGESGGDTITFGVRERLDVREWARFLEKTFPGVPVILDGVSMGAATVMAAAALDLPKNVRGIIADCGYTSMEQIFQKIIRQWFHLPPFPLVPLTSLYCRLKNGFGFADVNSANALACAKIPVLLAHGEADTFVPHEMAEQIYAAVRDTVDIEFVSVPGADHGLSYLLDYEHYYAALCRLYKKILPQEDHV